MSDYTYKVRAVVEFELNCNPVETVELLNQSFEVGSRCWGQDIFQRFAEINEEQEKNQSLCNTCHLIKEITAIEKVKKEKE